jgi:hypothetical protein
MIKNYLSLLQFTIKRNVFQPECTRLHVHKYVYEYIGLYALNLITHEGPVATAALLTF